MKVDPTISSTLPLAGNIPLQGELAKFEGAKRTAGKSKDPSEAARQFEALLVKQILSESMKSMFEKGEGSQVFGYFLEDTLADGITKGGGMGLRSVIESQLRQRSDLPKPDDSTAAPLKAGDASKVSKKDTVSKTYRSLSH
ncbi:MAG: hypothetical protein WCL08_03170 [Verrucomicrobiota bacterium]